MSSCHGSSDCFDVEHQWCHIEQQEILTIFTAQDTSLARLQFQLDEVVLEHREDVDFFVGMKCVRSASSWLLRLFRCRASVVSHRATRDPDHLHRSRYQPGSSSALRFMRSSWNVRLQSLGYDGVAPFTPPYPVSSFLSNNYL